MATQPPWFEDYCNSLRQSLPNTPGENIVLGGIIIYYVGDHRVPPEP